MNTTLNQIREKSPCADGWEKLLKSLNKTKADDEPLSLITILDSNGLEHAVWCLESVEGHDREIILYPVWCARQVQHLMTDQRSLDALDVAERYANGRATKKELAIAMHDSRDAGWDAARDDKSSAAWFATWSAESSDTCVASGFAAVAAARDAADLAGKSVWPEAKVAAMYAQEVKFREMFCGTMKS